MKSILILLLFNSVNFAGNDLIIKNSFEQQVSIGGTVSGLINVGLNLTLNNGNNNEILPISNNGSFIFVSQISQGESWSVVIFTNPTSQSCAISNSTGTIGSVEVTDILVNCTLVISGQRDEMNWDTGNWH